MTEKVSVIIPVYNCEKYLEETLQSILRQNYDGLEIIIVNDGSTDSSEEIIYRYALEDSRIQIINQENQGPSSARNLGIQVATGKYLIFFDSDDVMLEGAITSLVEAMEMENANIAIGGYILWMPIFQNKEEKLEAVPFLLEESDYENIAKFQPFPMNKMFRTEIVKKNQIRFANCWRGEDLNFYLKYLMVTQKVAVVDKMILKYRWCTGGLSQTASWMKLASIIQSFEDTRNFYYAHDREGDYIHYIKKLELIHYHQALSRLIHIPTKKDRYQFLKLMMKHIRKKSEYDLDQHGKEIYQICKKIYRKRWIYCSNYYRKYIYFIMKKLVKS